LQKNEIIWKITLENNLELRDANMTFYVYFILRLITHTHTHTHIFCIKN